MDLHKQEHKQNRYYTWIDHMLGNAAFAGMANTPRVIEGVETGSQRHRALSIVCSMDLGSREGWGEEKQAAAPVCAGTVQQKKYRDCRRIYDERQRALVGKWLPELEASGNDVGERIMERWPRRDGTCDGGCGSRGHGRRTKKEKERRSGKRLQAAAGGEQRRGSERQQVGENRGKAWAILLLTKRLGRIEDAPTTREEWKEYVPLGKNMRMGVPVYYSTFQISSEVAQRMAGIYSTIVEAQMLGGYGGGEASAEAAQAIGQEDTPRAGLAAESEVGGERSALASTGQRWAGGSAVNKEGKLTEAGLRLARHRWKREREALKELIADLQEQLEAEDEGSEWDSYASRMREAIRNGKVESTTTALIAAHAPGAVGASARSKAGKALGRSITSVKRAQATGQYELIFEPGSVREAVRKQGEAFALLRAYSIHACIRMLELGDSEKRAHASTEPEEAWTERIMSDRLVREATRRMKASNQAAGSDGWRGVMLRWADMEIVRSYANALREGVRKGTLPVIWGAMLVAH